MTQSKVRVLRISRQDMVSKLPKEFIQSVESSYRKRKQWQVVRMMDIQEQSRRIYKEEGKCDAYREAVDNVEKIYGCAN